MFRRKSSENKRANTENSTNNGHYCYDELVRRKIQDVFVAYIIPGNVLNVFWKYDQKVLIRQDIEYVKAETINKGTTAGAEKLLELLCRYENWVKCLIKVLEDEYVKQKHVAEMIVKIIDDVPDSDASTVKGIIIESLRKRLENERIRNKETVEKYKQKEMRIVELEKQIENEKKKTVEQQMRIVELEKQIENEKQRNKERDDKCKEHQMKIVELENKQETSMRESRMLIFAECKNFRAVQELIEKGVDINKTNKDGRTVLMFAAGDGNLESVVWYLDHGADTKIKDKKKWTALTHAAFSGSSDCLQALLDAGCQEHINASVVDGYTSLMLAASSLVDGFQCVQKLIDAGAYTDVEDERQRTALSHAAESGNVACLQVLLEVGRHLVNKPDKEGRTPLMLASGSQEKYFKCMQKLLAAGARADAVDNCGFTSLACATIAESLDCIQLLLQITENKQVNVANTKGVTPLMLAAAHNTYPLCLEKLLSAGADIRLKDQSGDTALAHASRRGKTVCIQALLEAGSEKLVYIKNKNGETPLMLAASSRNTSDLCLRKLLKDRAVISIRDKDGDTALARAARCGNIACIQVLLKAGSDKLVNIANNYGLTPLILAAICIDDSDLCIKELLKAGANINMKDHKRLTALDYAASHGNVKCVQILQKAGSQHLKYECSSKTISPEPFPMHLH